MSLTFCQLSVLCLSLLVASTGPPRAEGVIGYYREPAIHGSTVVFCAEEDLWVVGADGGVARRLTSHLGAESDPAISMDGKQIAFSAAYEGGREAYVMPIGGGLPRRLTWSGGAHDVVSWTPEGRILCASNGYSGMPDQQLVSIDPAASQGQIVPLHQASEGTVDESGTLYFTRYGANFSFTKRYRGGLAQDIWRFKPGDAEATPLTADYDGASRWPMCSNGRVYFVSDRDGSMNLWSMDTAGGDVRQHTRHVGWDVKSPDLHDGRVVYQLGADLRVYEIATATDRALEITLASDLDQLRENWIEKPMDYLSAAHLSKDGKRVVLTARGQVFVAPVESGRRIEATRAAGVRYRDARFAPDGQSLLALSDESGEVEVWRLTADGLALSTPGEKKAPTGSDASSKRRQITRGASVLRFECVPSPDGRWVAFKDKNQELWIADVASGEVTPVAANVYDNFYQLTWSPDSRWLAYVAAAPSQFYQIFLCRISDRSIHAATTDRYNSSSPAWDPKGEWLYFLSDRHLETLVQSPWGTRHPEPFFDRSSEIYQLALRPGLRSAFAEEDELMKPEEQPEEQPEAKPKASDDSDEDSRSSTDVVPEIKITTEGLATRLLRVPVDPGNYQSLLAAPNRLLWLSTATGAGNKPSLLSFEVKSDDPKPVTVSENVEEIELSGDGEKLLLRKEGALYVVDSDVGAEADLSEAAVDLAGWTFPLDPREEWRQMYDEAWRLERDYFYDRDMHGIDWPAMRAKYAPLIDRVLCRGDLSDVFGELIGELSALHMYVYGGEFRGGADAIFPASLGADLAPLDDGAWRVARIYRNDPDRPDALSPLARSGVELADGDVLTHINGTALGTVAHPGVLLRNQAGRQVRLTVRTRDGGVRDGVRDVIVKPLTPQEDAELRYASWEYERRLRVEESTDGTIGYLHLRAMETDDYERFARDYYPLLRRDGIIIDVRHNNGGNIDSWVLDRLRRPAWMWWQPRVGEPWPNMQSAYTGHLVVLVDEYTISDGEAFAEGFRRLGLGKVIGSRTWGGEIWLTSSNILVDQGIATAAEFGVYGPEGEWLIEGHGVEPDIVVDNLPHGTFQGRDAQLEAAIAHLREKIATAPRADPAAPAYPRK